MDDNRLTANRPRCERCGCLLVRVDSVPAGLQVAKRNQGRVILAYGEVTGHHHSIVDEAAEMLIAQAEGVAAQAWLQVSGEEPVALQHQEHSTIMIPPGAYKVVIQVEYSPAKIRRVAD